MKVAHHIAIILIAFTLGRLLLLRWRDWSCCLGGRGARRGRHIRCNVYGKHLHTSGPKQFKPMLFKGLLYSKNTRDLHTGGSGGHIRICFMLLEKAFPVFLEFTPLVSSDPFRITTLGTTRFSMRSIQPLGHL